MYKGKRTGVLIAAAGSGTRMESDGVPKQFMLIDGVPMIRKTVRVFQENEYVDDICIVMNGMYIGLCRDMMRDFDKVRLIVPGGRERQDSVGNAIREFAKVSDFEYLMIHDCARPYVSKRLIDESFDMAVKFGACTAAVPVKDTIRHGNITLERKELYAVQTPQTFERNTIILGYERACSDGYRGTDDGSIVERLGHNVAIVPGDYANIKITTKEDLPMEFKVGTGYDVHRFDPDRKLVLGGEEIPFEKGLLGHSDADVLAHAVMDALLGAAALGDIGKHFPDTDPSYRGISSMKLLAKVGEIIAAAGYSVGNIDATVIAQQPKLAAYIQAMRRNMAEALGIDTEKVSVKATTTEKLGFAGRSEGIAAEAVASISRNI